MHVDVVLVNDARRLKNGADVHRTDGLVRQYLGAFHSGDEKTFNYLGEELQKHVGKLRFRRLNQEGIGFSRAAM